MKAILFILIQIVVYTNLHAQVSGVTNTNAPVEENKSVPATAPAAEQEAVELEEVQTRSESKKKAVLKTEKDDETSVAKDSKDMMLLKKSEFMLSSEEARIQRTQRNPSDARQSTMNDAVTFFEKNAPQSFEYNYFKYLSGNYDLALRDYLIKAEKLRPDNSDVHVQLAAMYDIEGQDALKKSYLIKLASSGRLSQSSIQYGQDVLLSCKSGDFLIAHALEDAMALWYQQSVGSIREDVKILSLDLMQSSWYRKKMKMQGLKLPASNLVDTKFLQELIRINSDKSISLSLTIPKEYFSPISDKIYVRGLVFTNRPTSNTGNENLNLWNNTLRKHLIEEAIDDQGKQLSSNYLPMLLSVRNYYIEQNDVLNREKIEKLMQHIAFQSKKQAAYSKVK